LLRSVFIFEQACQGLPLIRGCGGPDKRRARVYQLGRQEPEETGAIQKRGCQVTHPQNFQSLCPLAPITARVPHGFSIAYISYAQIFELGEVIRLRFSHRFIVATNVRNANNLQICYG